jgi:hypothetical protein
MGLGFVLLIWAVLGTIAAVIAGAVLAAICALIQKAYGKIQKRWVFAFALLPFACGVYGFIGIIAYGVWCETVRGVDFGTGDSFRAPIVNGYQFQAIDTPTQGYLVAPDGTQFHQGVQMLGDSEALIFGQEGTGYFLLDSKSGTELTFTNESTLREALQQRGVTKPELLPPEQFYFRHRFGLFDWVAFGFGVGIPLLAFIALVFLFARSLRRRALAVPT